jgi:hypothetical protein
MHPASNTTSSAPDRDQRHIGLVPLLSLDLTNIVTPFLLPGGNGGQRATGLEWVPTCNEEAATEISTVLIDRADRGHGRSPLAYRRPQRDGAEF